MLHEQFQRKHITCDLSAFAIEQHHLQLTNWQPANGGPRFHHPASPQVLNSYCALPVIIIPSRFPVTQPSFDGAAKVIRP